MQRMNEWVLTGIGEVVLVVGGQKDVVLAGLRLLLGEVLVLDLGKLDHCECVGVFCLFRLSWRRRIGSEKDVR